MRVCICDDIIEFRLSIKSYIEQYFKEQKIKYEIEEFSSPEEIKRQDNFTDFDIFILDIEFGEETNGIDFICYLQSVCENPFFIIVTAYKKYLDKAMDLNVLRFIEKPIKQERIISAVEKAIDVINNSFICFPSIDGNIYRMKKKDIIYAEANMKKSEIITTNGRYICPLPFKQVKVLINSSDFLIPHNSFMINKYYISALNRMYVVLKFDNNVYQIPISATKQKSIRAQFNRHNS